MRLVRLCVVKMNLDPTGQLMQHYSKPRLRLGLLGQHVPAHHFRECTIINSDRGRRHTTKSLPLHESSGDLRGRDLHGIAENG